MLFVEFFTDFERQYRTASSPINNSEFRFPKESVTEFWLHMYYALKSDSRLQIKADDSNLRATLTNEFFLFNILILKIMTAKIWFPFLLATFISGYSRC